MTRDQQAGLVRPVAAGGFASEDELVATYRLRWYDASEPSGGHLDELIHHETDERHGALPGEKVAWHQRHLTEMVDGAIGIVRTV